MEIVKIHNSKEGNQMYDLVKEYIACLLCLEMACKDGHYQAKGIDFRQLHELFDTIIEGVDDAPLSDMRDNIQEIFFLGRGKDAMSGKEMLEIASKWMKAPATTNEELVKNVKECLECALDMLAKILQEDISQGENDLFGNQGRELQHRLGFLNRTLA